MQHSSSDFSFFVFFSGKGCPDSILHISKQFEYIKSFLVNVSRGVQKAVDAVVPEKKTDGVETLTPTPFSLLKRLGKIPKYFYDWKDSSTRAGAARALALVKAHYPQVDLDLILGGVLEKKTDQSPHTKESYIVECRSVRGYATSLAAEIADCPYFHMYDHNSAKLKRSVESYVPHALDVGTTSEPGLADTNKALAMSPASTDLDASTPIPSVPARPPLLKRFKPAGKQ